MLGTWINVGAVLLGSLAGLLAGKSVPEAITRSVQVGVGLVTFVLGTQLAIGTENALVLLLALLVGGALGTWLRIEDRLAAVGEKASRWFPAPMRGTIPQGFVAATLLFCVGPMAVLGSIRDGLYGDWRILGLKAVMDGISSIGLVAGLGPGVFLSAASVLVYQGSLTLAARWLVAPGSGETLVATPAVVEFNAVGGAVLIALSIKLLGLRDLKVGNLLPALALAPALAALYVLFAT
jgi:uncharacterized membrane protein YqgA involved in biofilm formation